MGGARRPPISPRCRGAHLPCTSVLFFLVAKSPPSLKAPLASVTPLSQSLAFPPDFSFGPRGKNSPLGIPHKKR